MQSPAASSAHGVISRNPQPSSPPSSLPLSIIAFIGNKYYEDDGTSVQECVFANANLLQVYDVVKKIDPNLKNELPIKNLEYPSTKDGCISVDYQYKSKKHLYIELLKTQTILNQK